jgi:hypothetical protein
MTAGPAWNDGNGRSTMKKEYDLSKGERGGSSARELG